MLQVDLETDESVSKSRPICQPEQGILGTEKPTSTSSPKACALALAANPLSTEKSSTTSNVGFCVVLI